MRSPSQLLPLSSHRHHHHHISIIAFPTNPPSFPLLHPQFGSLYCPWTDVSGVAVVSYFLLRIPQLIRPPGGSAFSTFLPLLTLQYHSFLSLALTAPFRIDLLFRVQYIPCLSNPLNNLLITTVAVRAHFLSVSFPLRPLSQCLLSRTTPQIPPGYSSYQTDYPSR